MQIDPTRPPDAPPAAGLSRLREGAVAAAVVVAAAVIRLANIGWGLPDIYEEATPFTIARGFWGNPGGEISFHPGFFNYPALSFYLHFALQAARFGIGTAAGEFASLDAFRSAMAADPGAFLAAARTLSAALDAGTVGLVWALGRRLFGSPAGLVAALLAAANPLMVASARSVNVDVVLAFFSALTLLSALRLSGAPSAGAFARTGALAGLAASAKYTGAVVLLFPALLLALRRPQAGPRDAALLPLAAAAVFAALNPYILLDPAAFLRDFRYEQFHMSYGHLGLDPDRSAAGFYLLDVLLPGFGLPALVAALAGAVLAVAGGNRAAIALGSVAAVYLGVVATWEMRADRYLLPAMPALAIFSAGGAAALLRAAAARAGSARRRRSTAWAAGIATVALLLAAPAAGTLRHHREISRPDTRAAAREWIEGNVAPGSVIVTGPYGVRFPPGRTVLYIPFTPTGAEAVSPFYDTRWYEDFELLVASDHDYARYAMEPERFASILAFYDTLRSSWREVARFTPGDSMRGPALWLYAPPGNGSGSSGAGEDPAPGVLAVSDTATVVRFLRDLSGAHFGAGRAERSAELLRWALRASPADPDLSARLAFVLHRLGRHREALDFSLRASAAGGDSFELLTLLGTLHLETGNPAAAEAPLLRARAKRPGSTLPVSLLVRLYSSAGRTGELVGTLETYLGMIPPGTEDAARVRGWIDSLRR